MKRRDFKVWIYVLGAALCIAFLLCADRVNKQMQNSVTEVPGRTMKRRILNQRINY